MRENVLRRKEDFDRIYRKGKSVGDRYVVIFCMRNDLGFNRIAYLASKKVGNSIVRHRLTRLIRESYRLNEEKVARGYDMVVIARSAAKGKNYHDIESAFLHLGSLHGIIES